MTDESTPLSGGDTPLWRTLIPLLEEKFPGYYIDRSTRDGQLRLHDPYGNVGVVFSTGYGAGWSTWDADVDPMNAFVAAAVLLNSNVRGIAEEQYPNAYYGGLDRGGLVLEFIQPGTRFKINEYDGFESLTIDTDIQWNVA